MKNYTPYRSPLGYHRHMCTDCGFIWEHGNDAKNNEAAHKCPACPLGESWQRYEGDSEPEETTRSVKGGVS